MGLNETISTKDGVTATSQGNGIDVHMMLPTEWGAIAILSASGYGNQKKLRDETNAQKRTTTGNSTGVYFTGDRWEIVSVENIGDESKYHLISEKKEEYLLGSCGFHSGNTSSHIYGYGADGSWTRDDRYCLLFGGNGIFSACNLISGRKLGYDSDFSNAWDGYRSNTPWQDKGFSGEYEYLCRELLRCKKHEMYVYVILQGK